MAAMEGKPGSPADGNCSFSMQSEIDSFPCFLYQAKLSKVRLMACKTCDYTKSIAFGYYILTTCFAYDPSNVL